MAALKSVQYVTFLTRKRSLHKDHQIDGKSVFMDDAMKIEAVHQAVKADCLAMNAFMANVREAQIDEIETCSLAQDKGAVLSTLKPRIQNNRPLETFLVWTGTADIKLPDHCVWPLLLIGPADARISGNQSTLKYHVQNEELKDAFRPRPVYANPSYRKVTL
jgi:hypothetical protein